MVIRQYRISDFDSVFRIFREVGWIEDDDDEKENLRLCLADQQSWVAVLDPADGQSDHSDGDAETCCMVGTGTFLYQRQEIETGFVLSVLNSRVARKQKLASRLTAHAVAASAERGALVSTLGMFDQGFYDRLGFGTGAYELTFRFDPADLRINIPYRRPVRFTLDDEEKIHEARLRRFRRHGGVSIRERSVTSAEIRGADDGFLLGYRDPIDGRITHHMYIDGEGAHGPYDVNWMAYETPEQFLELLGLLASLGDQVNAVSMVEPAWLQLQDFIKQPLKSGRTRRRTIYETGTKGLAVYQYRINNLPECLKLTHLPHIDLRFNLKLADPIGDHLPADRDLNSWCGAGGDFVVHLAGSSTAVNGHDPSLPTLEADVNQFTRLWMGIQPASSLALNGRMRASDSLLIQLDAAFAHLPKPLSDWMY